MEQINNQPVSDLQPNSQVTNSNKPSTNRLLYIIIVLLIMIVGYLFYQNTRLKNTVERIKNTNMVNEVANDINESNPNNEGQDQNAVNQAESEWLSYEYMSPVDKSQSFASDFKLSYPSNWTLEEKTRDPNYDYLNVWLTNYDGSSIEIVHGEWGAGNCVFKDSPNYNDPDLMMATQYETFTEVKNREMIWRLAQVEGEIYKLCEKRVENQGIVYAGINLIGIRNITLTTPESFAEFIEMLKKVEIYK